MKTFKSRRAFVNSQLHVLSSRIAGDDSVLRSSLAELGVSSCKELTDQQAQQLLEKLEQLDNELSRGVEYLKGKANINAQNTSTDSWTGRNPERNLNPMTMAQRNTIIKITRYTFNWSPEATFSFIVENCPLLRDRLSSWEIKHSKLVKLYRLMTNAHADFIIKKLDKIQERNAMWSWIFESILTPFNLALIQTKLKALMAWNK